MSIKNILRKVLRVIIPTKRNRWIFGAWKGQLYADNSKYLFEYIIKNHPEIDAIWITKNNSIVHELRDYKFKVFLANSIKGIWSILTAEAAFETEGDSDFSRILDRDKTHVIQLWHGLGYKAMTWKDKDDKLLFDEKFCTKHRKSWWMATSQLCVDVFRSFFGIPQEKFFITGYPRNDIFHHQTNNLYFEDIKKKWHGYKLVIYMPTHRQFGKNDNQHINVESMMVVNDYLKKEKVLMVYKPHFHELKNFEGIENTFSNIIFAKDSQIFGDVYSYLNYFDLLISDYSSIITDFACSHKPVILFPYDIEEYKVTDGLGDWFFDNPLGPFCYSWEEVLREMSRLLTDDYWKKDRENNLKVYHCFNDGNNCKRVYEATLECLKIDLK